uniref:Tetratricopeptide repeat domain 33 n=1 Tax=Bos mutus grunniens TaxID=30521 RepID=A0A8B9YLV1_BOSMU
MDSVFVSSLTHFKYICKPQMSFQVLSQLSPQLSQKTLPLYFSSHSENKHPLCGLFRVTFSTFFAFSWWFCCFKRPPSVVQRCFVVFVVKSKKAVTCLTEKILRQRQGSRALEAPHKTRYREAIQKWDEALQLTPNDATLYEMKSQVLMSLHEMFPAVHAAEMAVQRNPHSWESWQTLGRAQLGLGEIVLAIRSFQVALHIYPMNPEIWKEDLSWARTLQEQQKVAERIKKSEVPAEVTHFSPKSIPDYDFESDEIVAVCAAIAEKQKTVAANKTMVIVSASGTVETVTEKEDGAAPPDASVFIKAR